MSIRVMIIFWLFFVLFLGGVYGISINLDVFKTEADFCGIVFFFFGHILDTRR